MKSKVSMTTSIVNANLCFFGGQWVACTITKFHVDHLNRPNPPRVIVNSLEN